MGDDIGDIAPGPSGPLGAVVVLPFGVAQGAVELHGESTVGARTSGQALDVVFEVALHSSEASRLRGAGAIGQAAPPPVTGASSAGKSQDGSRGYV